MATINSSPLVVKRIDHIQMDVANLEESIAFYGDVFGFTIREVGIRAMTRWAIIGNSAKTYLCMHEYPEGRGKQNDGLEITHFGLIVEDFESALAELEAHHVRLAVPHHVHYHKSRSIYFYDPNGYKIEISEYEGGGIDN